MNKTAVQRIFTGGITTAGACLFGLGAFVVLAVLAPPLRAQQKSFLWKVQSERNALYILGSIHFLKRENYPLSKGIEAAYRNAKKLVLEIDLNSATPEKTQQYIAEKGLYRDGTTLEENIDKETYTLAEQRAQELGIDLRALSSLKPWVVALTLTALKLRKLGFDPSHGVDRYLAARAQQDGKSIGGLETLEFQINLMDQLSRKDQESMLHQTLKDLDIFDKSLEQIVRSWSAGDAGALQELLLAGMREYPAVHRKLIVDRNRRWLPQIERMIREDDHVLVVVGAAHLTGQEGVIELLKARGYGVEQMP